MTLEQFFDYCVMIKRNEMSQCHVECSMNIGIRKSNHSTVV